MFIIKIEIKDVEFGYSKNKVLDGISINIDKGECVSILGPNGTGKSTLIKCIDGLLKPQKGTIKINGEDVQKIKREKLATQLGYVAQSCNSAFSLTVFDMVLLGRSPYIKWKSSKSDELKVFKALKKLNIEDIAMKNFNELSGGQQQKVIIARALAQETEILLLDEATSNLDIRHQLEVMYIIKKLTKEENITAVMIVHDLNIAARFSDKILIMKNGKINKAGIPEKVLTKENISDVYGVEVDISRIEKKPCVIPLRTKCI